MAKRSPFDYVKSINEKSEMDDLSGYNPFLTNRAFAYHLDTILLAEEMNQAHHIGPQLQYDFYYNMIYIANRSLSFVSGMESNTDIFTIHLSGFLNLNVSLEQTIIRYNLYVEISLVFELVSLEIWPGPGQAGRFMQR